MSTTPHSVTRPASEPQPHGVVVVDDSSGYRQLLRMLLATEDRVRVVGEAADGAEGIAAVRDHEPDLVITDQQMPGVDGLELVRVVRAGSPDLPIVMLTGSPHEGLVDEAADVGVTAFIRKQDGVAPILTTVQDLLDLGGTSGQT